MNNDGLKLIKSLWEKYGYKIFLFMGLFGVVLIYISEIDYRNEKTESEMTTETYRLTLEQSLTELLSEVDGAGKVKLMVTLESGEENVYAMQEKTDSDEQTVMAHQSEQTQRRSSYENEIVMTDAGSGRQPVIEKTLRPPVQGVVVVCQGAGDITVVSNITNAVSVALNIPTNRVCVIKMQ